MPKEIDDNSDWWDESDEEEDDESYLRRCVGCTIKKDLDHGSFDSKGRFVCFKCMKAVIHC